MQRVQASCYETEPYGVSINYVPTNLIFCISFELEAMKEICLVRFDIFLIEAIWLVGNGQF